MPDFNQRRGQTGLPDTTRPAPNLYPAMQVLDSWEDARWGREYDVSKVNNNYFDYYYSGQDVICCIDGTEDDDRFRVLPLLGIGYSVQQQKAPVFGFWSYTYDAVMRGTRVVQGRFVIATRTPDYMKQLLAKAAQSRAARLGSKNYTYVKGLTEDDKNIEEFWGKNRFDEAARAEPNIFSSHPPFSFVIIYGVQNVSLNDTFEFASRYSLDNPWMTDTNERLIEADVVGQTNRIILDACELQSKETQIGPDGAVITETYTFFGRDEIIPST